MNKSIDDVDFTNIDLSEFRPQIEKIHKEIEKIKKNKKIMKKLEKIKTDDDKEVEVYDIFQNNIDSNSDFKPIKNIKTSFKGNNQDSSVSVNSQIVQGLQPFC